MQFVKKLLKKSFIKFYKNFCFFVSSFLFFFLIVLFDFLNITGIVCVAVGLGLPIVSYIILRFFLLTLVINIRLKRVEKKFKKEVEKIVNYEVFSRDIEYEMSEDETIQYFYDINSSGILMTKKWFIFISLPIILVKHTADIYSITEHIDSDSLDIVSFKFKDDTFFNTHDIEFMDFEPLVRNKYPAIVLNDNIDDE